MVAHDLDVSAVRRWSHERAINLQCVYRETVQITPTNNRSEIVNAQLHPELFQRLVLHGRLSVVHYRAFSNLEL